MRALMHLWEAFLAMYGLGRLAHHSRRRSGGRMIHAR